MKIWQKIISVVATFALLFINSLATPLAVLAQTDPTPTPTVSPTDSATPVATPDATPTEIASPTPEVTPTSTDLVTPVPSDRPVVTQAPESNPTVQGPPFASPQSSTEAGAIPSVQPTVAPETPVEHGNITTTTIENINLSGINLLNSNVDGATVTTDKADYSPTSVALITGTGFTSGKTYSLEISSTDEPPVDFKTDVTADSQGTFSYAYQLDGNYRPNYKVEVKIGELVVTSTTFTDSTKTWTGAANDGDWTNGANWGGTAPTSGDTANIPGGLATVYPNITSNTSITTVVTNSNNTASPNGGRLTVSAGTFTVSNTVTINANGTISVTGGILSATANDMSTSGTLYISSGTATTGTGKSFKGSTNLIISGGTLITKDFANTGTNTISGGTIKVDHDLKPTSFSATGGTVEFTGADGGGGFGTPGTYSFYNLLLSSGTQTVNDSSAVINVTNNLSFTGDGALILKGSSNTANALYFSGVQQVSGTWGSTASTATHKDNTHFVSGTGMITIAKADQATLTVTGLPGSASYAQAGITAGTSGGSGTGAVTFSAGVSTACSVNLSSGAVTISSGSGTCSITATKAADTNYNSATSDPVSITVNQASSTTAITCPASEVYTGSAITPCSVSVTGAGGLNLTPTPTYGSNIDVGTVSVSYTYAGDANHTGSGDSKTFEITPADSTTVVTFEAGPYTYRGSAFTATANVTGVGGLNESVAVVYSGDCTNVTVADGCTATATYAGDANHNGSTNSKSITITKASASCTISGYSGIYDTSAHGASGSCTGVGEDGTLSGLGLGSTFTNVPCGTANWTFTDETGNYNNNSGSVAINISKADATILVTPYNVAYDGSSHTAGGSATGVVGEDLSADLNLTGTSHTNKGNYPTDSWTFTDSTGNYNNNSGTVTDNITKADQAITVTIHAPAGAANGADFTVAATGGSSGNAVTYSSGTPSVCTNSGATFTMINSVGTCTVQYNQAGNANYNNATQVTESTEALLTISSEASSSVTDTSVTVTWTTDHNATSRVVYDTVSHDPANPTLDLPFDKYGYANTTDEFDISTKVASHSVVLTGLTAGTTYYYRTISHGSPEAVSGEQTFTTSTTPTPTCTDGMHLDASGKNCVNFGGSGPAPRNDEGTLNGQVLGISTVAFTSWPKLAYAGTGTNGSVENVLGTETQVTGTPSATPAPEMQQEEKVSLIKWILTHKKISGGVALLLLAIAYGLYRFNKKNK